ncbi:MAG: VWA domain-containing protein, partial [Candidatus Eisenbacteria sp.]|nr:VWA domain-containing protein [Candidatus Eisenbacteria bacterium]
MVNAKGVVCLTVGVLLAFSLCSPALAQLDGRGGRGFESVNGEPTNFVVDPESFDFTITCNETVMDSLCVTTPASGIIRAADIVFVMDATGSMGQEINEVKSSALNIMQSIIDLGIDAAFGVGAFQDYPHSYSSCGYDNAPYGSENDVPWTMHQDITTNTADVANAINGLELGDGRDLPENYSRAL